VKPSLLRPATWRALLRRIDALERLARSLRIQSSPDIFPRASPSGTVLQLSRRIAQSATAGDPHPFRVSPQGDEHVTLRPGAIRWWDIPYINGEDSDINFPVFGRALPVAAIPDIEVTAASGTIYLIVPVVTRQITEHYPGDSSIAPAATFHLIPHGSTAPTAIFAATEPAPTPTVGAGDLIIPVATVAKEDGIARVTNQILRENILLSIQRTYWGS
jgi:hypothetical protein